MLKANIKLPIWLGLVAIIVSVVFTTFSFNPLVIIIYIGTLYLIVYFSLGYIKREDAIVVDRDFIKVRTPFKDTKFTINNLKNVYLADNGSTLKAVIFEDDEEEEVTLCSNIYDKNLSEILDAIIKNHSELSKKHREFKQ